MKKSLILFALSCTLLPILLFAQSGNNYLELSGSYPEVLEKVKAIPSARIMIEQENATIVAQRGSLCLTYIFNGGTLVEAMNAMSHDNNTAAQKTLAEYQKFLQGKAAMNSEAPTKWVGKVSGKTYQLELSAIGADNVDVKMKLKYGAE